MGTLWTGESSLPVFVHDGLEDGGEGCHSNSRGNKHSMLGPEYVARGSAKRSIHVDLVGDGGIEVSYG